MIAYGLVGFSYMDNSENPKPPFYMGVHIALIAFSLLELVKYITYLTKNLMVFSDFNPLLIKLAQLSEILCTISYFYPILSYSNLDHKAAVIALAGYPRIYLV